MKLPAKGHAVLAPQSGGCARHVLSQRVAFTSDEHGGITVQLDKTDDSGSRLLIQSTVTLNVEDYPSPSEELLITGKLEAIDESHFRLHTKWIYHVNAVGEKRSVAHAAPFLTNSNADIDA